MADPAAGLADRRILVTGPAGQIAFPIVESLVADNEVWGIARFGDPAARERVEATGCRTAAVDLADPDWSALPDRFDHVLHLAAYIVGDDFEQALRINAEGTGLVMARFAEAESVLVMSSSAVYRHNDDPEHLLHEDDPLGEHAQTYAPTYSVAKNAQEAVARTMARSLELPTVIARMNMSYGPNGGLPAYQLDMMRAGMAVPVHDQPSWFNLIHQDDINAQVGPLLDVASVPATVVNWAGNHPVEATTYVSHLAEVCGLDVDIAATPDGVSSRAVDVTRLHGLIGPCAVDWRDGLRRMAEARHPDLFTG